MLADQIVEFFQLRSREKFDTSPPSPHFLSARHFSGEGGGGVYFEAPRGRNLIRPPFLYAPHP